VNYSAHPKGHILSQLDRVEKIFAQLNPSPEIKTLEQYRQVVRRYLESFIIKLDTTSRFLSKSASEEVPSLWEVEAKAVLGSYNQQLLELKTEWIMINRKSNQISRKDKRKILVEELKSVEEKIEKVVSNMKQEIIRLENSYNKYPLPARHKMSLTHSKLNIAKGNTLSKLVNFWWTFV
jgi:hypothetical protein